MDSKDSNFIRLHKMITVICPKLLWEILLRTIKPPYTVIELVKEISNRKSKDQSLYTDLLSYWEEIKTVTPTHKDFDICTLCTLINFAWKKQKQTPYYRNSVEFIRKKRNELAHLHSSITNEMYETEYFTIREHVDNLEQNICSVDGKRCFARAGKTYIDMIDRIDGEILNLRDMKKLIKEARRELKSVQSIINDACESGPEEPLDIVREDSESPSTDAENESTKQRILEIEKKLEDAEANMSDLHFKINVQKEKVFQREEKIDQQEKTITKLKAKITQSWTSDQHVKVKTTLMEKAKMARVNNQEEIKQKNDNAVHDENGNEYVTEQENGIAVQQEVDKSVQQYRPNTVQLDQLKTENDVQDVQEDNEKESQQEGTNFEKNANIEENAANQKERKVQQEEKMLQEDLSPLKYRDNAAQINVLTDENDWSKALKEIDKEHLLATLPEIDKDICTKTVKYKGDLHYVQYEAWAKIKRERELLELDVNKIKNKYDTKHKELLHFHETCITENFKKQQEEIKDIELDCDRKIQKHKSLDLGDERFHDEQNKILQSKKNLNRFVILNRQHRKMELDKSLEQQIEELKNMEENEIQEKKQQCEATIALTKNGLKYSKSTIRIKNHRERKQLIEIAKAYTIAT